MEQPVQQADIYNTKIKRTTTATKQKIRKNVHTLSKNHQQQQHTYISFINEPTNEQENESNLHLIGPYLVFHMYIKP